MRERPSIAIITTSLILAGIGFVLTAGGLWLLVLGGSFFYLLSGAAFLATATLLFLRHRATLWVYAVYVALSLVWAVWETGFDWWQLGPRGGIVVILGLWLLAPAIRRKLVTRGSIATSADARPLALALIAYFVVAFYSMTTDPHGFQGTLPTEVTTSAFGGDVADGDWPMFGRTSFAQRYSPLAQITKDNVGSLKVAWQYRTGDLKRPGETAQVNYEATPLKVGNTVYLCTPHSWAIALDAVSGKELWKFDAEPKDEPNLTHRTCRGVAFLADPAAAPGQLCAQTVYLPTTDARVIALDAASGRVCTGFGDQGAIDLKKGMKYVTHGHYYSSSPPLAIARKVIVGGLVDDNFSTHEESGVVRAFDAKSGALVWNWDSGNPDATAPLPGGESYVNNSPNMWSVASADEQLGLIYLPMGNQTPDAIGQGRSPQVEKFAASIVALELETGRTRWVRQTVHHDLWDMDVPSQPVLFDLKRPDGSVVPALVGPTKQGDIYVLDRRTGEPIIPIKEVPAPSGVIAGDGPTSPTQPESALSFYRGPLQEKDMWGVSLLDQMACRISFHRLRYEGRYTPPSTQGTIIYPGYFGVFNWGSVAIDPERQIMFNTPVSLAFTNTMIPAANIPTDAHHQGEQGIFPSTGAPYGVKLSPYYGPLQIPCHAPPWGYVAGVDLRTAKVAYTHINGTVRDMTPLQLPFNVGVPGLGGPILTRGGVAFYSGAVDDYLRAYDATSGEILWAGRLPAGAQASPISYLGDDQKQYVVIVAGGNESSGTKAGDYVVAYTLP